MHLKYKVFQDAMDSLKGQPPPPGWNENLIKQMIQSGATLEDLRQISEAIKGGGLKIQ